MADPTPQAAVDSVSQEVTTPVRIGSGSFATVFASPGRSIVVKLAHLADHTSQVEKEFNSLHSVYTLCNSDSIFAIPRALAFYDPLTKNILFFPPSPGRGRRRDPRRPFEPDFFANLPPRACYVMDRAAPLPPGIAELVRSKFYSERALASKAVAPLMCRLYFGKQLRPSAFVNPNNFPIDVTRYDALYMERQNTLLPKEEVAAGMGEMLSRIQWIAGYDARDIEFVMAGAPDAAMVRLYVIDFNQMRSFDKHHGDVSQLADAFFSNDPYYPRPVQNDPIYGVFKDTYMSSCPSELRPRATLFLQTIEARQAAKSASV
ncbi:hypothetical protein GSI_08334 [Ganoderma sinense ZZ0214-1]|uniref:DUF3669 domain-containing protein n=1 Tax=Ganoderma sinense ZZ0214-1 TaxID=1077348 RepID=A0A2G8S6X4_9APHY|nr:hypothetical protein GSI_08334 [Ganoderma sinense ZZ0214-1]